MQITERLVLDRLELENFKSYAGHQSIGPFHEDFSAVVGPNGSGKSNVLDAILFVFGYRASRMRQPKATDLIHVSATFPSLTFCSVTVHFRTAPLPAHLWHAGELAPRPFSVTRRVAKTGASEYWVDGQPASYKSVQEVLLAHGLDVAHDRFVMLQGEVEAISLMKPKATGPHDTGLLEYLEDLIGLGEVKDKIVQGETDLEAAIAAASGKRAAAQRARSDLEAAAPQRDQVVAYLEQANAVAQLKASLCMGQAAALSQQMQGKAADLAEAETQRQALLGEIEAAIAWLEAKAKKDSAHRHHVQEAKHRVAQLEQAITAIETRLAVLDAEMADLRSVSTVTKKGKRAGGEAEKGAKQEALRSELAAKEQEVAELKSRLVQAEQSLAQTRQDKTGAKTASSSSSSKKDATKERQLTSLNAQVSALEEQRSAKAQALALLQTQLDCLESDLAVSSEASKGKGGADSQAKTAARLADRQRSMAALQQEIAHKQAELEAIQSIQKSLEEEEKKLTATLQAAQNKQYEMKAALNAALASQGAGGAGGQGQGRNAQQNVAICERLMAESQRPGSGFHTGGQVLGRLCDLVEYDVGQYGAAMEAAAGATLTHIVLDGARTGTWAMDVLKRYSLGRCTFLILDKLAAPDQAALAASSPLPTLFSLIRPSSANLLPAIWYAVRDTLVAPDMAAARPAAFDGPRRRRVVTLDGQLIDKSGAMSGGGGPPAPSAASTRKGPSPQELARLRADLASAEQAVQAAQTQLANVRTQSQDCATRLETLQGTSLRTLQLDYVKAERECAHLTATLQELDSANKSASTQSTLADKQQSLQQLRQQQAVLRDEETALTEAWARATADRDVLERELLSGADLAYRAARSLVTGLKEQLATLQDRMDRVLRPELAKLDRLLADASAVSAQAEADAARNRAAADALDLERQGLAAERTRLAHERDAAAKALKSLEAKDPDAKVAKETQSKLTLLKQTLAELEEQIEADRTLLARLQTDLTAAQKQLNNLTVYILPTQSTDALQQAPVSPDSIPSQSIPASSKELDKLKKRLAQEEDTLKARYPSTQDFTGCLAHFSQLTATTAQAEQDASAALEARDAVKASLEDLKKYRLDTFLKAFHDISLKLKEIYQMITMGGNAELELVDSLDPFSEGVLFSVMPPKKTWKSISNLSGGEKTLSSLALIFALHHYRPTPFYVLDEIDAALDFRNVSIIAAYLRSFVQAAAPSSSSAGGATPAPLGSLSSTSATASSAPIAQVAYKSSLASLPAQVIVISLRAPMFELADALVGIYKSATRQVTRSVTLVPAKIAPKVAWLADSSAASLSGPSAGGLATTLSAH